MYVGYRIIGAASDAALKPFPPILAYSVSKWAVRGLTQGMAMELGRHAITVNAYAPGYVGTPMWDQIDQQMGEMETKETGREVKKGEVLERLVSYSMTALGRVSVPEDVAKVVGGYLAGPDSAFVTGQTVVVDGGIQYT